MYRVSLHPGNCSSNLAGRLLLHEVVERVLDKLSDVKVIRINFQGNNFLANFKETNELDRITVGESSEF